MEVPRPRLSVKGGLPRGIRLGVHAQEPLAPSPPHAPSGPESSAAMEPPPARTEPGSTVAPRRPLLRALGYGGVVIVILALGVILVLRTGVTLGPPADDVAPQDVPPAPQIVYAAIDLWSQQLQRVRLSREILASDERNLIMLRSLEGEDMTNEERIFVRGIEGRRAAISQDVRAMVDTVITLHLQQKRWPSRLDELVQRKLDQSAGGSDTTAAERVELLESLLEDVSDLDEEAARERLTNQLLRILEEETA